MRWPSSSELLQVIIALIFFVPATTLNCQLPKDRGYSCDEPETRRFYYDTRMGVCQPMMHRGCGGNENKFDSVEHCKEQCMKNKGKHTTKSNSTGLIGTHTAGTNYRSCWLPPIRIMMPISPEHNVFASIDLVLLTREVDECDLLTDAKITDIATSCDNGCGVGYACNKKDKCCPMKEYICSLPASSGSETRSMKHYARYVYQPGLSNCIRFSYFGSGGNFNNFKTYNDCKKFCMEKKPK